MTGETGMALAVVWRKRQTVQSRRVFRKMEAATGNGCWQTVRRDVQLQRERRPQTATTWQAWYQNELIEIRWRHTVQHSVCCCCVCGSHLRLGTSLHDRPAWRQSCCDVIILCVLSLSGGAWCHVARHTCTQVGYGHLSTLHRYVLTVVIAIIILFARNEIRVHIWTHKNEQLTRRHIPGSR